MRKFKFRAWDTKLKSFIYFKLGDYCAFVKCGQYVVNQFSGLLDKNGKDIYEGDIIGGEGFWGTVIFEEGMFLVSNSKIEGSRFELNDYFRDHFEIIGNIFENSVDKNPISV